MKNNTHIRKLIIHSAGFMIISILFVSCIFDPVSGDQLSKLQKYHYVSIDFNADIESNHEIISFSGLSVDHTPPFGSNQNWNLEWNGTAFSVNYDYNYESSSVGRVHTYGTIGGTLSDDGLTIESLTADQTTQYLDEGDVFKNFITVIDVPYDSDYLYNEITPRFGAEGEGVSNHIYSYNQSWSFTDSDGNPQNLQSTSINYKDPDDEPYLHVTFSGD